VHHVASSEMVFQQQMDNLNKVTRELSMKINAKKMKVMCINQKDNNQLKIYADGQQVEQVSQINIRGCMNITRKIFGAELDPDLV